MALLDTPRDVLLVRARRLAMFTLAWNLVEGVVAVTAAVAAGSRALIGFGLDSGIESISAAVLLWRLGAEMSDRPGPTRPRRWRACGCRASSSPASS